MCFPHSNESACSSSYGSACSLEACSPKHSNGSTVAQAFACLVTLKGLAVNRTCVYPPVQPIFMCIIGALDLGFKELSLVKVRLRWMDVIDLWVRRSMRSISFL
jgi:hypothetical protein